MDLHIHDPCVILDMLAKLFSFVALVLSVVVTGKMLFFNFPVYGQIPRAKQPYSNTA